MTETRDYLDVSAGWGRLDADTQTAIGALVLKIAVCRARRTHADPESPEAHAGAIAEAHLHDQLYALARQALPEIVTSGAAIKLLSFVGLAAPACLRRDPRMRAQGRRADTLAHAAADDHPDKRVRP